MKTFCNLKCSVTPHSSLNTFKGIVFCPALSKVTPEHIIEFMGEQGVTDVRRITVRHDGIMYAATVLNLNIAHLASVINLPNVSTAQVTTLQTLKNAHSGKREANIKN